MTTTVSKTIHAGTTPENMVIVAIREFPSKQLMTTEMTAVKALSLAAELIHAANAVLERTLEEGKA